MVRTPFALFDTAPILGVRKPLFLTLPNISTNSANWSAPSYSYMNSRPRYLRRPTSQSPKPLSALETSFSPSKTIESLRLHRWSGLDGQYIFLSIIGIFALSVIESPGPIVKTLLATLLITGLVVSITRQFLLPGLPVITWAVLFYSASFIPAEWRPSISVRMLPTVESILYGANLSNILSKHTSPILDVLAWLPYGIIHFGAPVVCSGVLFLLAPPGTLPVFARSFGYMSLTGVLIQLCFPCSPPWYENMYGFAPADYSMNGSPGGLQRIDTLFGLNLYTSSFSASPVVFGAFPSLHAGWATLHALYLHHLIPQARVVLCVYVLWVWWATMYLTHHYFVDLIGGSCLAVTVFYVAQRNYLPQVQPGKLFRWHYDSVTKGHYTKAPRDLISSRSRANSAAAVAAWQINGSFIDLETGLVQGVPPNSEDEDVTWEMQELSPAEEVEEGRSGSFSPSTEGSSAGLDSIWTMESDVTSATSTVQPDEMDIEDDGSLTVRGSPSKKL